MKKFILECKKVLVENSDNASLLYHGSVEKIGDELNKPINWITKDYDYAKTFTFNNGYIYTCKASLNNLFNVGKTDARVYDMLPIKPYKLSKEFKSIVGSLNIDENTLKKLLSDIVHEYSLEADGYKLTIRLVVRSDAFRKIIQNLGYNGIKAIEYDSINKKDVKTYGIFNSVKIISTEVINESLNEYFDSIDDSGEELGGYETLKDCPVYMTDEVYRIKSMLEKQDLPYRILKLDNCYLIQDARGNKTHYDMYYKAETDGYIESQYWDDDAYMVFIPNGFNGELRWHTRLGEDNYYDCRVYDFGIIFVRDRDAYNNDLFTALGEPIREISYSSWDGEVTVNDGKSSKTLEIDNDLKGDPNNAITIDLDSIQGIFPEFLEISVQKNINLTSDDFNSLSDDEKYKLIKLYIEKRYNAEPLDFDYGSDGSTIVVKDIKWPSKNESLQEKIEEIADDSDMFICNSLKEVITLFNRIHTNELRVLFDKRNSTYYACNAFTYIHMDLAKKLLDDGYIDDREYYRLSSTQEDVYAFLISKNADISDDYHVEDGYTEVYRFGDYFIITRDDFDIKELSEKLVKKGNKWQVQSEDGTKNLGTYDTKKEAEKRLQQVHYFKSLNESKLSNHNIWIFNSDYQAKEFILNQQDKELRIFYDGKQYVISDAYDYTHADLINAMQLEGLYTQREEFKMLDSDWYDVGVGCLLFIPQNYKGENKLGVDGFTAKIKYDCGTMLLKSDASYEQVPLLLKIGHIKSLRGHWHKKPKIESLQQVHYFKHMNEEVEDNILDALDKEFGQEEVYMWSTYVLPNGHFLNPDKSDYFDEENYPDYEHCDFEDWAYQKGYRNKELQDVYNNCLKMNVTWPYVAMPDKSKPTQEQLQALREIIRNKDAFIQEGFWNDVFPVEKFKDMGPNVLAIYTPVGDELFDLDVSNEDDIIRAINQAYVRGGFFNESLDEDYTPTAEDFPFTLEDIEKAYSNLISDKYEQCGNAFIMPDGRFILSGKDFNTHIDFSRDVLLEFNEDEDFDVLDEWDYDYSKILDAFTKYFKLIRVNDGSNSYYEDRVYFVIPNNQASTQQWESLKQFLDVVSNDNRDGRVSAYVGSREAYQWWDIHTNPDEIVQDCKNAMRMGYFIEKLDEEVLHGEDTDVRYSFDCWATKSPYEVKNILLSSKDAMRVFIDENQSLYLVGRAYECTHTDMIELANDNGIDTSMDDFDNKKVCIVYSPKDEYNNTDDFDVEDASDDDYTYYYEYNDFVIFSRYQDFDTFELSDILGSHKSGSI